MRDGAPMRHQRHRKIDPGIAAGGPPRCQQHPVHRLRPPHVARFRARGDGAAAVGVHLPGRRLYQVRRLPLQFRLLANLVCHKVAPEERAPLFILRLHPKNSAAAVGIHLPGRRLHQVRLSSHSCRLLSYSTRQADCPSHCRYNGAYVCLQGGGAEQWEHRRRGGKQETGHDQGEAVEPSAR